MPEPAVLTGPFSGIGLRIDKQDVHRLQLWVESGGNGGALLPVRKSLSAVGKKATSLEYVTVLNIPGTALGIMATLMVHGLGFTVKVMNDSSVTTFFSLSNK